MLPNHFERQPYALVAEQTAWGKSAEICDVEDTAFEILESTLAQHSDQKPNSGRFRSSPGMIWVEGNLTFYMHVATMGFWLRQLMMTDSATSTQNPTEGGTVQITTDSELYAHVLRLSNRRLPGLTIEVVEAGKPSTFDSLLVNEGSLHFADQIITSLSFLGREADLGRGIGRSCDMPTDVSSYNRLGLQDAERWNIVIEVEGNKYPVSRATLSVNHNLGFSKARFSGTRFMPKPVPKGNRAIHLSATIDNTSTAPFYDQALMQEVTAKFFATIDSTDGLGIALVFDFPHTELIDFPNPGESGKILLRPYGARGNSEMILTIVNTESSL